MCLEEFYDILLIHSFRQKWNTDLTVVKGILFPDKLDIAPIERNILVHSRELLLIYVKKA